MKFLILLFFCLATFPTWANPCPDHAKTVLSSSSQQRFVERGFLPKLFSELIEIVHDNRIVIKNAKVKDIILQFDDDARTPRIINLFEVANAFGVNVSDLFKHYGNLMRFIDPSGIVTKKKSLTPEKKYRISERIHLHLSGLIEETLRKKNLTLEKLALQTGIKLEIFHLITVETGLPRLHSLLQILLRLDADVVDFFRRVEVNLEEAPLPRYFKKNSVSTHTGHKRSVELENRTMALADAIDGELNEIFESIDKENLGDGAMRFRNMIFERNPVKNHRLKTKAKRRTFRLKNIFQAAHMLGMRPSEVLKYAGHLKSHAKLDGIKNKTLLNDETVRELLRQVNQGLVAIFGSSKISQEELAERTQLSPRYLSNMDEKGLYPSYSILERILEALDSNTIRFFEELEGQGKLDVRMNHLAPSSIEGKSKSNQNMGAKISQIREILPLSHLKFNRIVWGGITRSIDLAQRNLYFKSVYKTSRVTGISLSDLSSERPVEALLAPLRLKIERVPREEVKRAERLLTHLLLSEARRQREVHGLTVMGLAIKSRLMMRHVRKILAGEMIPPYSVLQQIVETGFGLPMFRFFEDFEMKLKSFDRIPFASKKTVYELEGLYLSERVKTHMQQLQGRFDSALEFVKSLNVSWEKLRKVTGIQYRFYQKKTSADHYQVSTVIKFCHFLGIGMRDFLGHRHFSELTARERLNFERLSEERLLSAIASIKRKASERRKTLKIPMKDLEIMIGAPVEKKLVNSLFGESIREFSWFRYFQLVEILAREGVDDLFLLDGVDL